jgi:hypothetical protein
MSTWAEIASNDNRDVQLDSQIRQTKHGIHHGQESYTSSETITQKPKYNELEHGKKERDRNTESNDKIEIDQNNSKENVSMEVQEMTTERDNRTKQGKESEQSKTISPDTIIQDTTEGKETVEIETMMVCNEERDGETREAEQQHSNDSGRGEGTHKERQITENPMPSASRPKKIKIDNEDPTKRNRNCSKTRLKKL